ncbi:hypothetical protein ACIBAH_32405 [Streptomyces sp. NPDC051445]|uniref:hypothetical protein n=1 Tax=Streptomyces sp. NPDC051445 TaxID=3365653 RepID=UPI00378BF171
MHGTTSVRTSAAPSVLGDAQPQAAVQPRHGRRLDPAAAAVRGRGTQPVRGLHCLREGLRADDVSVVGGGGLRVLALLALNGAARVGGHTSSRNASGLSAAYGRAAVVKVSGISTPGRS